MKGLGDVAVIGGGISGIATAYYLSKAGFKVDLYEREDHLGGRIGIRNFFGRELCFGGKNIGRRYRETRSFFQNYGDPEYEEFGINTSKLDSGKVQRYDGKSIWISAKTLAKNITLRDAKRIGYFIPRHLVNRRLGDADAPFYGRLAKSNGHPTLSDFFDDKTTIGLLRAATVRMNGAEPDEIYLQTLGSNLQMLLDQYDQVSGSLSSILDTFSKTLSVHFSTEIENVTAEKRCVQIRYRGKEASRVATYSHVVVALAANQASQLLIESNPDVACHLSQVRYFPVAVVVAEYDQAVFTENRRAMLFPSSCVVSNAGAYGLRDLNLVRYTLSGRAARAVLAKSSDRWLREGEMQLREAGLLHSQKLIRWQSWLASPGLCAYTPKHREFLATLRDHEIRNLGLHFVGDYIKGASIENCFRSARAVADGISKFY